MRKRKIRLDLEELAVDSFSTEMGTEAQGTVRGYESEEKDTGIDDCWSFVLTGCGNTVWEAGCSTETAPIDCSPTEGGYTWCQTM